MRPIILQGHWQRIKMLLRLKKEAEEDGEYRVARRLHAVVLNMEGNTSIKVADVLKAPRSKVSEWLKLYAVYGVEGLLEGHRSGRPSELSKQQITEITDIVDSGPVSYGFTSGVWTSPMITRVIHDEFGVQYHPGHVRKILHEIGFSVQRPKRMLAKADEEKRSRWIRYLYPNIKKKPKRSKRH